VGLLIALGLAGRGVARAGDTTPLDVLTERGLTRTGKYFVVASEAGFLQRWGAVRPDYEELVGQYMEQVAIQQTKAHVYELDDERIVVLEQIAEIDNELRALPPGGNSFIKQRRQELENARKGLDNRRAALRAEIDLTRKRLPPEPQIRKLYQEFERHRQEFLHTTSNVRPLVDQTLREYNGLSRDPAVKNALNALRQSMKSQLELGPSPEFKKAQKELSGAQRNVQLDAPSKKGGRRRSGRGLGLDASQRGPTAGAER
jgi:hypothetical protein